LTRALGAAVAAVALMSVAACGSSSQAATVSQSQSASASSPGASPSPSGGPPQVFAIKDVTGGKATGNILVTKGSGTFTVELQLTGLAPGSSHVSHIHVGTCQHPGGIRFALNQVIADGTGAADTRTQVPGTFPPTGSKWYVVVHIGPDMQGSNASYLLCGNLS
jgi:hypothetical protein